MGMPARFDEPEFQAAVKKVFDICLEKGVSVGIFCDNPTHAAKYRAMGANFLWMCTDDQIVQAGLRALIAPMTDQS